jgi:hypothetical protein
MRIGTSACCAGKPSCMLVSAGPVQVAPVVVHNCGFRYEVCTSLPGAEQVRKQLHAAEGANHKAEKTATLKRGTDAALVCSHRFSS